MMDFESKHGIVLKSPAELYMAFTDMRGFLQYIPADKREGVTADADSLHASVQGFDIGMKVTDRTPYSRIGFADDGSPFPFRVTLHFDAVPQEPWKTDFHILLSAELNLMMKMLLGGKLKEAMDKMVDGLVDVSAGKVPEGFDPSQFTR